MTIFIRTVLQRGSTTKNVLQLICLRQKDRSDFNCLMVYIAPGRDKQFNGNFCQPCKFKA